MLDMKFVRANPEVVKENIKKKFQEEKLPLVDKVIAMDAEFRAAKTRCDELRSQRNSISKQKGYRKSLSTPLIIFISIPFKNLCKAIWLNGFVNKIHRTQSWCVVYSDWKRTIRHNVQF